MDMTLIDVTHVPSAKIGDKVILVGEGVTATEVAKRTQTIEYEVCTSISKRVPRVYINAIKGY